MCWESTHGHRCHKMCMAIREQPLGVASILPYVVCWGLNSGPQALGQGLYPLSHLVGSMVLVLNGSSYVGNHDSYSTSFPA